MSNEVEWDVLSSFDKISCKILSHDGELLAEDLILTRLVSSLRRELELKHFFVASIHKCVSYQAVFDNMQIVLKEHKWATIRYFNVIIKMFPLPRIQQVLILMSCRNPSTIFSLSWSEI